MPSFLDTQETSQRFGKQIAEFCSLLDVNHIRHGSPEDFFEFARVLERSNQFRYDLSALVKSVVRKEHEELLLTDMMSILAACIGGPSSADTRADITGPTNTLMEFLLGTGCWRQFGSPLPPSSPSARPPHPSRPEDPMPLRTRFSGPSPAISASVPLGGEIPGLKDAGSAREGSGIPENPEGPEGLGNPGNPEDRAALAETSNDLRQTLTRLEINTLEVKHHLDAIEQRLSRMEPLPEVAPVPAGVRPERLPWPGDAGATAAVIAQPEPAAGASPAWEPELPTRGRAVFSHLPEPPQSREDETSAPTFGYAAEEEGRRVNSVAVVFALLAIAAIVASCLFFVPPAQRQALTRAGMSRLDSVRAFFGSAPPPVPAAPSAGAPSTAVPADATPEQAPQTPPSAVSQGVAASAPAPSAVSNAATAPAVTDARPSPAIRYVQSKIMEGKLLSAPRPEYPADAREAHIEGTVALQAVISKSGSVETLHVVKGPPALRGAAISAVRDWRYRPYVADGQPIEVATTIYVDFTLSPPPALVR